MTVVSNGVDVDLFRPATLNQDSPDRSVLRLVYLGNFVEKDRFEYLLEVLPAYQGRVQLELIGEGRNKANVLAQLRKAGVKFCDHGQLLHENIPAVLAQCQLGVIFREAHTKESIPVCIYEFCAMGLPVIGNSVGVMGDFVLSNDIGFIISSSAELKQIIDHYWADRKSLEKFAHLPGLARERFSLAASRQRFRELLKHE